MKTQAKCFFLLMILYHALSFPLEDKAKKSSGHQASGNTKDVQQKELQEQTSGKAENVKEKAKFGKALESKPKEGGQKQRHILNKIHERKFLPIDAGLKEDKDALKNQQQQSRLCPQCISATVQSRQIAKQAKISSPQEKLGLTELKPKKPAEVIGQIHLPLNQPEQIYAPNYMAYPNLVSPNLQRGSPNAFPYPVVMGNGYAGVRRNQDSQKKAGLDQEGHVTSQVKSKEKEKVKAVKAIKAAKQMKGQKQSKRQDISDAEGKRNNKDKKTGKENRGLNKSRAGAKKAEKKGQVSNEEPEKEKEEKEGKKDLKKAHEINIDEHESGSGSEGEGSASADPKLPVRLRRNAAGIVPVTKMKVKSVYV